MSVFLTGIKLVILLAQLSCFKAWLATALETFSKHTINQGTHSLSSKSQILIIILLQSSTGSSGWNKLLIYISWAVFDRRYFNLLKRQLFPVLLFLTEREKMSRAQFLKLRERREERLMKLQGGAEWDAKSVSRHTLVSEKSPFK